jgi:hypothetical protein
MSMRTAFQNMASKDCAMLVGADVSEALTYKRLDTGASVSINGVIAEDGFAVPGIIDSGLGTEDRTAVGFFAVASMDTALAGRSPLLPVAGDKVIQTIGTIVTSWVVKTQPRLDGAGGIYVNLRLESVTEYGAKNMGSK